MLPSFRKDHYQNFHHQIQQKTSYDLQYLKNITMNEWMLNKLNGIRMWDEKSKTWTCSSKSFSEIKFLLLRRMKEKSEMMSEVWMRKEKESWELRRRELGKTWWSWKTLESKRNWVSQVAVASTRGMSWRQVEKRWERNYSNTVWTRKWNMGLGLVEMITRRNFLSHPTILLNHPTNLSFYPVWIL